MTNNARVSKAKVRGAVSNFRKALVVAILLSSVSTATCSVVNAQTAVNDANRQALLDEMKRKATQKGKAVYAKRQIKAGEKILSTDIEEREIDNTKIPVDAITQTNLIEGRWAKKTIEANSIVSQYSISFRDPAKATKTGK